MRGTLENGYDITFLVLAYIYDLSDLDPFQNLKRRKDIFSTMYHLPDILAEARITSLMPLRIRDGNTAPTFGFVVSAKQQIMVCEGTLATFSQSSNNFDICVTCCNSSHRNLHQDIRNKWATFQHYQHLKHWCCLQSRSPSFRTSYWLPVPGHSAFSGGACEALRLPTFFGISLCSD